MRGKTPVIEDWKIRRMKNNSHRIMPAKLHRYKAFGLTIESELELPMLSARFESPEVCIRFGETPEQLDSPLSSGLRYQLTEDEFLLNVDNIARYWVQNGKRITIQPLAKTTHEESHLYLLGSVFGALLHQQGKMLLHGSAVEKNGRAIAFIGESGAGKSTLAAAFKQRGFTTLTDDICVITFDEKMRPHVESGYPRAKLWEDSLELLNIPFTDLPRVRAEVNKHSLLTTEYFQEQRTPLSGIYLLTFSNTDETQLIKLTAADRLKAIRQNTFRKRFLVSESHRNNIFRSNLSLAQSVSLSQLIRSQNDNNLNSIVDTIIADLNK